MRSPKKSGAVVSTLLTLRRFCRLAGGDSASRLARLPCRSAGSLNIPTLSSRVLLVKRAKGSVAGTIGNLNENSPALSTVYPGKINRNDISINGILTIRDGDQDFSDSVSPLVTANLLYKAIYLTKKHPSPPLRPALCLTRSSGSVTFDTHVSPDIFQ